MRSEKRSKKRRGERIKSEKMKCHNKKDENTTRYEINEIKVEGIGERKEAMERRLRKEKTNIAVRVIKGRWE